MLRNRKIIELLENDEKRAGFALLTEKGRVFRNRVPLFFNINTSITCMKYIKIGDYCKFCNILVIADHDHDFKGSGKEFPAAEIGSHVWVGVGCIILKGLYQELT